MSILIIDDSPGNCYLMRVILNEAGFSNVLDAQDALKGYEILGIDKPSANPTDVDIVLLDIMMPDINGIDVLKKIKSTESVNDIPVIMVTSLSDSDTLKTAFMEGAIDYITKPFNEVELIARVHAALKLKEEMDRRKEREKELVDLTQRLAAANMALKQITNTDGLTGIANRRFFDEVLEHEWRRAMRVKSPISLIFLDVDFFKPYNDCYGHLAGDECLKRVAEAIQSVARRAGDVTARYGGEEFAVILPELELSEAVQIAEKARMEVENLNMPHEKSVISKRITISAGVSSVIPEFRSNPTMLIDMADKNLYVAKHNGRNSVAPNVNKIAT